MVGNSRDGEEDASRVRLAASVAPEGARLRVLVVEDHEDSREMLKALLEAEGHEVQEATDGVGAVEVATSWRPDCVLLDVGLPLIDGFEAARRIRSAGGTMRLVALTGYGQPEDVARSREAGFDEHLVKPVDARRVAEAVTGASPGSATREGPGLASARPSAPVKATSSGSR